MNHDKKKVAYVFGGTGLIGHALLNELVNNDSIDKIISVGRKKIDISDPKFENYVVDDIRKQISEIALPAGDIVFCCIGTTLRKAGSKESFRKVDFDIPVQIARFASQKNIPVMLVVSSLGADPRSSNFYLRTKGEMEESVQSIFKGRLKFIRPSLLLGNRQEKRWGESIGIQFMNLFGWLFAGPLKKYRGIPAIQVAKSMVRLSEDTSEKRIYESHEL